MLVNKEFMEKENELKEKYAEPIKGISNHYDKDINVAFYMLVQNARNRVTGHELYQGAGEVDCDELRKDVADLDALRRI